MTNLIISQEEIAPLIHTVRDKQIILDSDLARLYQVETKALNRVLKRNENRFPENFCFQLTEQEAKSLRYQFGTSNVGRGGRRYLAFAFSEQGVAMMSALLRSDIAVKVSIEIMNAFVEMRKMLISNSSLFNRLDNIELKQL